MAKTCQTAFVLRILSSWVPPLSVNRRISGNVKEGSGVSGGGGGGGGGGF